TYALFRMVCGFLFLWHGRQKLFSFPLDAREGAPAFITYGAGGIKLIAGALIMFGLFTRPAALHGLNSALPITNGGELAVMYCFAFLFISAKGAGIWSIDGSK
ncbi:MAG: DoxX family protein, partial [Proteobacteria bacterium]|nr:DoxX family protein [Pseudomonadota bacterium]